MYAQHLTELLHVGSRRHAALGSGLKLGLFGCKCTANRRRRSASILIATPLASPNSPKWHSKLSIKVITLDRESASNVHEVQSAFQDNRKFFHLNVDVLQDTS